MTGPDLCDYITGMGIGQAQIGGMLKGDSRVGQAQSRLAQML